MSGSHLSKEFFDLVKSIGESRSKQEEDKIIVNEVHTLKQKMSAKDVPAKKMKEYLIRMIYVEMLGHDASFGHIHGIKMAHNRALLEKRVGYLAVSLTLHKDHSFMLLLINTLQKDLQSDNYLECSMALTVVSKLVNTETIPAILPLVVKLLDHKEGNVKKKAVMVLHRFHQLDPQSIATLGAPIRKALCDSNISVMAASLNLFLDLCSTKASGYKDLVPDFVSILKQVIEHRLPRDYDYHRMPAPWVQLKLLQILSVLGASDKNASEGMYEILREVMKRADIGINVGYAIVYECVRTVTSIYPDPALIEDAASSISRFITSDNHNLKYLGVNALASIVQIDSKYAAEHQLVVIDCLEDPDETLKRKTLDLLYSMTNPQNVTVIVQKLTSYLQTSTDQYLRSELVSRINQLSEKFAPSNQWFISTMNNVFELSGATSTSVGSTPNVQFGFGTGSSGGKSNSGGSEKLIKNEMSQSILRLISENANQLLLNYPDGHIPQEEEDIRQYAVDTYVSLLQTKYKKNAFTGQEKPIPDILIQVIAWVLGEYGNLSSTTTPQDILTLLTQLMERQVDSPALTKSWILGAILKVASKILAEGGTIPQQVIQLVTKYQNSLFVDLQQRSFEFLELLKSPRTFTVCVPKDNTFDLDVKIDEKLTFLDGYVDMALKNGAKPYNNDPAAKARMAEQSEHSLYGAASGGGGKGALKFQAYAAPEKETAQAPMHTSIHAHTPSGHAGNGDLYGSYPSSASTASAAAPVETLDNNLRLGSNVARRWGPSGYNDPDAQVATPAAAPPASTPAHHGGATMVAMPSPQQQAQTAAALAFSRQQELEREAAQAKEREKERKAKELASRPRELTEREKMAQSLFAGVASTPAAPVGSKPRAAPVTRQPVAHAPVHQQQQPVQPSSTDFLGGLIDAVPAPAPAKPSQPADSLDLLFGGPASAPAPAQPVQQQHASRPPATSGADLFDVFGGGGATAPVSSLPSQQQQHSAPLFDNLTISGSSAPTSSSGSLLDDPFGFATPPASGGDLFSLGDGSTKYGQAGSHLTSQLAGLQKAGSEVILVNDPRVQLSSVKGYTEQSTVVALFLSNKTSGPIQNVQISFNLPNGFAVNINGDGGAQVSVQGTQQLISFPQLSARATVTQLVQLSVRELSVFAPSSGAFGLTSGSVTLPGSAPLTFTSDLSVTDFLRPAQMKTDVYGTNWKALGEEVKGVARPTTCNTSADFMTRISNGIRAFPVQTIGAENICAGRIVAAPGVSQPANHFLVLVHGKVHSHIDLIVRSKSRELSSAIAKQLAVILK